MKHLILLPIIFISAFANAQKVDWFNLLGKKPIDKEYNNIMGRYGEHEDFFGRTDIMAQFVWTKDGLSVTMNDAGEVRDVYFMNGRYKVNNHVFNSFTGVMPFGITLDDKPKQVIEKLGTPTKDEGKNYRRLYYKTNYEYEMLFEDGQMQYLRIGLLKGTLKN